MHIYTSSKPSKQPTHYQIVLRRQAAVGKEEAGVYREKAAAGRVAQEQVSSVSTGDRYNEFLFLPAQLGQG